MFTFVWMYVCNHTLHHSLVNIVAYIYLIIVIARVTCFTCMCVNVAQKNEKEMRGEIRNWKNLNTLLVERQRTRSPMELHTHTTQPRHSITGSRRCIYNIPYMCVCDECLYWISYSWLACVWLMNDSIISLMPSIANQSNLRNKLVVTWCCKQTHSKLFTWIFFHKFVRFNDVMKNIWIFSFCSEPICLALCLFWLIWANSAYFLAHSSEKYLHECIMWWKRGEKERNSWIIETLYNAINCWKTFHFQFKVKFPVKKTVVKRLTGFIFRFGADKIVILIKSG